MSGQLDWSLLFYDNWEVDFGFRHLSGVFVDPALAENRRHVVSVQSLTLLLAMSIFSLGEPAPVAIKPSLILYLQVLIDIGRTLSRFF